MQINRITTNKFHTTNFKGRIQLPDEKFFTKKINELGFHQKDLAEKRIHQEEISKLITKPKGIINKLKLRLTNNNPTIKHQKKSLNHHWRDSISTLKTLAELKLPEHYTLKINKSDLGGEYISFQLFEGKKYAFGLSTSIENPKFPVEMMEQVAIEVKNGRDPLKISGYKNQWKKN